MRNCYVDDVKCVHLTNVDPWCPLHPKVSRNSQPSVVAVKDDSICGDYEGEQ